MIPDRVRLLCLMGVSAAVGWLAWSGHLLAMPASALFPLLWSKARTRTQAAAVSLAYFLAASRGLPQGVSNFYALNIWPGLLLWLTASLAFVLVHTALWTGQNGWQKPFRFLFASIAVALPPLGIMGWAHPITPAGVLFPGWGWWGLAAMAAGLAIMTTRHWPAVGVTLTGFWLASGADWKDPGEAAGWQGLDLQMGAELGRNASLVYQRELIALVRDRARATADSLIVVLPESALGFWTPGVARLWQSGLAGSGIIVIAGAAEIRPDGYDNMLVLISAKTNQVLYRQRMPVPGSMWQPWTWLTGVASGVRSNVFGNPVVKFADRRIAALICYEQLIVWPVLHSMLHDPDVLVAVGNGWWTNGTSIVEIQEASVEAWSRLFDVPLVRSLNR